MGEYRQLTQAELMELARERFGPNPLQYAFECPSCGDVASIDDFIAAGADPGRAGQECIGRSLGALAPKPTNLRGCNWVAYGLIPGPWEIVLPAEDGRPERTARSFPLASGPAMPLEWYGPAAPKACAWALTPTRRALLAEVKDGQVYAEAGQAWHRDGTRRSGRIVEALAAGWVVEGARELPCRRVYELVDAGRVALGKVVSR